MNCIKCQKDIKLGVLFYETDEGKICWECVQESKISFGEAVFFKTENEKLKKLVNTWKKVVDKLQKKVDDNFKSFIMPEIEKFNLQKNDLLVIRADEETLSSTEINKFNELGEHLAKFFHENYKGLNIGIIFLGNNISAEFKSRKDVKELLK